MISSLYTKVIISAVTITLIWVFMQIKKVRFSPFGRIVVAKDRKYKVVHVKE